MNRYTSQDSSDFQNNVVWVDLDIVLGAAGATAGVIPVFSDGILSIVSVGAGVYTVTFQDGYRDCLNVIPTIIQASFNAAAAYEVTWGADNTATATPTITLTTRTAAGAAFQPLTGDRLKLSFRMKR